MGIRITDAEVKAFKDNYPPRNNSIYARDRITAYRMARDLLELREVVRRIAWSASHEASVKLACEALDGTDAITKVPNSNPGEKNDRPQGS